MSEYLPARRGSGRMTRADRDAARVAESMGAGAALEIRRVRAVEAVECARVEAVATVATVGLIEVANLSALELALFQRTPHAARRLEHVADSAAHGIGEVVSKLPRKLR